MSCHRPLETFDESIFISSQWNGHSVMFSNSFWCRQELFKINLLQEHRCEQKGAHLVVAGFAFASLVG